MYRGEFKPSKVFTKPHVSVRLPVVTADTDEHAQFLATTSKQRILALLRGDPLWLKPPYCKQWMACGVRKSKHKSFLTSSVIGSPITVAHKLSMIAKELNVDDLSLPMIYMKVKIDIVPLKS